MGRSEATLPHAGSAVIVSKDGHVLTSTAVTEGANLIYVTVCLQEVRTRYRARLIARDDVMNLALLKVEAETRWRLPWLHRSAPDPQRAHVMGWPLLVAASMGLHEVESSTCTGVMRGDRVSMPLSPGFEGAPLFDDNGDGLGIVREVVSPKGVLGEARVVPVEDVRRFLEQHGISPTPPVGFLKRPWRIRLRQLQNCVALVERLPPREAPYGMPRLAWRVPTQSDDVMEILPTAGDVVVRSWAATTGEQLLRFDGASGRLIHREPVGPGSSDRLENPRGILEAPWGRYQLDHLGRLTRKGPADQGPNDLVALNGYRRFRARGPLQASEDGRLLLAGDALVWGKTSTVLWRLALRHGEPVRLLQDGSAILIGRRSGRYRSQLEKWALPPVLADPGQPTP